VEMLGGVFGEEGEYGDDVELLVRERRSLDILSVKKEARLSARALTEVQVGRGEKELRCNSLFIVCQRRQGLSEDEETRFANTMRCVKILCSVFLKIMPICPLLMEKICSHLTLSPSAGNI